MTKIIDENISLFKHKIVYFSDLPYDVPGCHLVDFLYCGSPVKASGFTVYPLSNIVIDLTQGLDTIWNNMDRKSTRHSINRAKKDGIRCRINKDFEEFYRIHENFARIKYPGISFIKGGPGVDALKKHGTLFTAEHEGEILAGNLYLEDEENIVLWQSASKRLEVDKEKATMIGNANRLLHWEAIQYGKGKGLKEFNWAGIWPGEQQLNAFKESFGGTAKKCYNYRKIYSRLYNVGYDIQKTIKALGKRE